MEITNKIITFPTHSAFGKGNFGKSIFGLFMQHSGGKFSGEAFFGGKFLEYNHLGEIVRVTVFREKMNSGKCHSGNCFRENDRESLFGCHPNVGHDILSLPDAILKILCTEGLWKRTRTRVEPRVG